MRSPPVLAMTGHSELGRLSICGINTRAQGETMSTTQKLRHTFTAAESVSADPAIAAALHPG